MYKRILYAALTVVLMLSVSGCLVAESSYLKKVEEADTLTKNIDELRQKYTQLSSDNSALRDDYAKLKAEAAGLSNDKQRMSADIKQLEDVLKAKSDTFSTTITDFRQ